MYYRVSNESWGGVGSATQANTYTAVGTAGEVLTSNGAGIDPTYQTVTGTGTVTVVGQGVYVYCVGDWWWDNYYSDS